MERANGILLPVFSLPSPYGIGSLGQTARDFVDFLCAAGQKYWQVLPLGPTSYGDSPYQSLSSFAGNPYFIDLDALRDAGLLTQAELASARAPLGPIDYGKLYAARLDLLRKAHARADKAATAAFAAQEAAWVADYALFQACKAHFSGKPYWEWPDDIRRREPSALLWYRETLAGEIDFHIYVQSLFYAQWFTLRAYANERGVRLFGDLPIYVPRDSADVWARPDCFQLDGRGDPTGVAGVPPDYFNDDGQLWGNPLYNWDAMAGDGYAWWMERMAGCVRFFDVTRIDHFRGLAAYWRVPYGEPTARNGAWLPGPGRAFIAALRARFPDYPVIAEDLGVLTDDVRDLLAFSGYPGMKVLQFAFNAREPSDYLPHNYERNCVCYTGTHDNTTLAAWFREQSREDARFTRRYLGLNLWEGRCYGMLRGGMGSTAAIFIACMQDYLRLGPNGRINTPGTAMGNWRWRLYALPNARLAAKIAAMAKRYGR